MFSVHLPSKMDIWQVSAYSLQAPPLTGLTLTGQCHLHKFLSLLPLLSQAPPLVPGSGSGQTLDAMELEKRGCSVPSIRNQWAGIPWWSDG